MRKKSKEKRANFGRFQLQAKSQLVQTNSFSFMLCLKNEQECFIGAVE